MIVNSHRSSETCGVGPADSTGKSVVRYCPGGSFTPAGLRLPENPREMIPIPNFPYLPKTDVSARVHVVQDEKRESPFQVDTVLTNYGVSGIPPRILERGAF
jgi:hypothetical protein